MTLAGSVSSLDGLSDARVTASCRTSTKERGLHGVGVGTHDAGGVARGQGLAEVEGAVQPQAQRICQLQVVLDLHLLGL